MRELRELALGGLLLTSWAVAEGWSRSSLFRRLREEGWATLGEGAWAEPGRASDLRTRLRATQLAAPGLVVSHRAAAWLWRIELLRVEAEFTDPDGLRKRKYVRVHRCAMRPEEIAVRDGLRVTSVDRTLADLLVTCPRDEALVAVESALAHRTVTDGESSLRRAPLTRLDRVAASLAERSHGAARARRHLTLADPTSGSPAETMARLRMYDAGLRPETQARVLTGGGRVLRVDFLFRERGVAVEIEGYAYHGRREDHRRDVARFNDLQQSPEVRVVLRFTAEEVFHSPETMLAAIRRALG
ncbi:hypothetical protein ACFS5L_42635 [Streptomyces phyllanthi]|uniref:DUF559 domain-containing protein n=1 Tax=Streptomyces phyllanthi TaxID=1803180 RepID=A0A5N8WIB7_9ACTN|nr:hypothetical protein [Streptomyces phyllanthi]MPY46842.1 hypothetical protein [Streptomyces phyllanthi]